MLKVTTETLVRDCLVFDNKYLCVKGTYSLLDAFEMAKVVYGDTPFRRTSPEDPLAAPAFRLGAHVFERME